MPVRRCLPIFLACIATAVAAVPTPASAGDSKRVFAPPPPAEWVPGELVVQFERGTAPAEREAVHARRGAEVKKRVRGLRVDVVKLPPGLSVAKAAERYLKNPD